MESVLGGLAFATLILGQFTAVIAVHFENKRLRGTREASRAQRRAKLIGESGLVHVNAASANKTCQAASEPRRSGPRSCAGLRGVKLVVSDAQGIKAEARGSHPERPAACRSGTCATP
jgi:hypothetical protein